MKYELWINKRGIDYPIQMAFICVLLYFFVSCQLLCLVANIKSYKCEKHSKDVSFRLRGYNEKSVDWRGGGWGVGGWLDAGLA